MRVITNKISRETREMKSTPSRRSCGRCGGFLVNEHCMDLDIGAGRGGDRFWAKRCVQCGDMIDEMILRNRQSRSSLAQGSRHSVECERKAA